MQQSFEEILGLIETQVRNLGLLINYTKFVDPFFKGDLDGKTIFIGEQLSAEEKVFDLLHLSGHCIQWNTSETLRKLGSTLYRNPDTALLNSLQLYEWQANCYGLSILHKAGIYELDEWLDEKYLDDMMSLIHFYKTGEKIKHIKHVKGDDLINEQLVTSPIPQFNPHADIQTRNGLVISF